MYVLFICTQGIEGHRANSGRNVRGANLRRQIVSEKSKRELIIWIAIVSTVRGVHTPWSPCQTELAPSAARSALELGTEPFGLTLSWGTCPFFLARNRSFRFLMSSSTGVAVRTNSSRSGQYRNCRNAETIQGSVRVRSLNGVVLGFRAPAW